MKQGKSIEQLGLELKRQRLARKDIITSTNNLSFYTNTEGVSYLCTRKPDKTWERYLVSELTHRQIASKLNIPFRYYEKMRAENPMLLDENIISWFKKDPQKRMIRTMDHTARAFLSDRYRRLDNLELCASILPVIREMKGAEIKSCEVTDTHMYIKVVNRTMKTEIRKGDAVQAGFIVANSEVGLGSLRVEPLVYRLVCDNGMIAKDFGKKKYHAGRQIACEEDAYELYSDATLEQDDKAFFMKVQDIVRSAVDETRFNLITDRMKQAADSKIRNSTDEEIRILADKFLLNEEEQNEIMRQFFMGGDNTWYGLINAVTAASKEMETYERATDLERIGGDMLSMPFGSKKKLPILKKEEKKTNLIKYAPIEEILA